MTSNSDLILDRLMVTPKLTQKTANTNFEPNSIRTDPQSGYIIHQIQQEDTLQRISLLYGVKIQDVKKINKLYQEVELRIRKEIVVPTTKDNFLLFLNRKTKSVRLSHVEKLKLIENFVNETNCVSDLAKFYLERSNYNFEKSIQTYYSDENRVQKMDSLSNMDHLFDNGSSNDLARKTSDGNVVAVRKLEKDVKNRLTEEYDSFYDL
eukprot:TRINITY_DN1455_c0_g1_i4.p1 TRINITY_DN1455_c0_g1~~TRINITY_DN1455_c0_g1_i4.p1  ORF type:complete len:208 (-),score=26.90 TRINITY_DN1455_c0_g1_i4:1024-1647(-)